MRGVSLAEILDLDDIDKLVELLYALVELSVVTLDGGGDPRQGRIVRRCNIQRVDVKSATAEQTGDARKNTEFVLH